MDILEDIHTDTGARTIRPGLLNQVLCRYSSSILNSSLNHAHCDERAQLLFCRVYPEDRDLCLKKLISVAKNFGYDFKKEKCVKRQKSEFMPTFLFIEFQV